MPVPDDGPVTFGGQGFVDIGPDGLPDGHGEIRDEPIAAGFGDGHVEFGIQLVETLEGDARLFHSIQQRFQIASVSADRFLAAPTALNRSSMTRASTTSLNGKDETARWTLSSLVRAPDGADITMVPESAPVPTDERRIP